MCNPCTNILEFGKSWVTLSICNGYPHFPRGHAQEVPMFIGSKLNFSLSIIVDKATIHSSCIQVLVDHPPRAVASTGARNNGSSTAHTSHLGK